MPGSDRQASTDHQRPLPELRSPSLPDASANPVRPFQDLELLALATTYQSAVNQSIAASSESVARRHTHPPASPPGSCGKFARPFYFIFGLPSVDCVVSPCCAGSKPVQPACPPCPATESEESSRRANWPSTRERQAGRAEIGRAMRNGEEMGRTRREGRTRLKGAVASIDLVD